MLFQRNELFQSLDKSRAELNWNQLVRSVRARRGLGRPSATIISPAGRGGGVPGDGVRREKVPGEKDEYVEIGEAFPSEDPQYIIYTSGSYLHPQHPTKQARPSN